MTEAPARTMKLKNGDFMVFSAEWKQAADLLRTFCRDTGFSQAAINSLVSEGAIECAGQREFSPCKNEMRALIANAAVPEEQKSLACLGLLFVYGSQVSLGDAKRLLGGALVNCLAQNGIFNIGPETSVSTARFVRSSLRIAPVVLPDGRELVIAADWDAETVGRPLVDEHVMGVGKASLTLTSFIPTKSVNRAADIGCGCGIQALAMSGFADSVIATDVSSRALLLTQFNARLNGIDNIETRRGSLFEPLNGESFDVIASNPPFVITPDTVREQCDFTYRDAGMSGDALVGELVRSVGKHLEAGGRFVMLANWYGKGKEDEGEKAFRDASSGECAIENLPSYARRIAQWVDGGLSWMIARRDWAHFEQYVHMWLRDGGNVPALMAQRSSEGEDGVDGGKISGALCGTRYDEAVHAYEELFASWVEAMYETGFDHVNFGIVCAEHAPVRASGQTVCSQELGKNQTLSGSQAPTSQIDGSTSSLCLGNGGGVVAADWIDIVPPDGQGLFAQMRALAAIRSGGIEQLFSMRFVHHPDLCDHMVNYPGRESQEQKVFISNRQINIESMVYVAVTLCDGSATLGKIAELMNASLQIDNAQQVLAISWPTLIEKMIVLPECEAAACGWR